MSPPAELVELFSSTTLADATAPKSQPARVYGTHGAGVVFTAPLSPLTMFGSGSLTASTGSFQYLNAEVKVGVPFGRKDRTRVLQHLILEPVPVYLTSEQAILATSQNRHAAILWLEWMASSESQKIADDQEPMGSSHLFRGGGVEQELRGKKLSWVNWEQHVNMESWMARLFQAYGFPNAQR
jgi:hypothetical protein